MPAPSQPPTKPTAGASWTAWGDAVDLIARYVNGIIDSHAALDAATAPKRLGTVAAAGTSTAASPADHVHPRGWWTGTDLGYVAWAYDPAMTSGQANPGAAGRLELTRVHVDQAATVTNIEMVVSSVGVTLTAGQCFAALYTAAGALLAQTGDQATAWTSLGVKTMALSSAQSVAAGDYYVAFWYQGTTAPQFSRQGNTAAINGKLAAPNLRYATANTGTTTTAPGTLGTQTSANNAWWVALS